MLDTSVIICAYTEERWSDLLAAIESVRRQTVAPREIIVVIDHNANLLQRSRTCMPDVVVLENSKVPGTSSARNWGSTVARGSVLAFLDDDAVAEPDWLANCLKHYDDPRVLGVGGALLPAWMTKRPGWFPEEFNWVVGCTYRGVPQTTGAVRNLMGANMSVRKEVFISAGGFLNGYGCSKGETAKGSRFLNSRAGDEETEFCIRVAQQLQGYHWLHEPAAVVRHTVPPKRTLFRYFLWRCYDEGYGKAVLSRLVGFRDGLAAERHYVMCAVPLGVARGIGEAVTGRDIAGLARSAAIAAGFSVTTAGYLVGLAHTRMKYQETIVEKFGQV